MSTALVTGGLGFIGRHVVSLLRERGERVRVLDLQAPDAQAQGVEYWQGSVTDRDLVARAVDGTDTVYHLAARAGLWSRDPSEFERINRAAARNVVEAAERFGVRRVVHTSTESVLKSRCAPKAVKNVDESEHLGAAEMCGAYCVGKLVAEQEALAAAQRGVPVVVVNPSIPVGPGDRLLTPPSRMLLGFLNSRYPAYLDCLLNLVDVRDVAEGHVLAATHGRVGERYLLSHANIRLQELLALLGELSGRPMPRRRVPYWLAWCSSAVGEWFADHVTGRPPPAPLTGVRLARSASAFDNTKAVQELGATFRPLESSLRDALAWYQDQGLLR